MVGNSQSEFTVKIHSLYLGIPRKKFQKPFRKGGVEKLSLFIVFILNPEIRFLFINSSLTNW